MEMMQTMELPKSYVRDLTSKESTVLSVTTEDLGTNASALDEKQIL